MKTCTACHQEKELAAFNKKSRNPDGHDYQCRECTTAYLRQFRQDHPDRVKTYKKTYAIKHHEKHREGERKRVTAWHAAHPDAQARYSRERRARDKGAETDGHTSEELAAHLATYGGKCWICLKPIVGKTHVDHVWPLNKGGSNRLFNLRPACAACNVAKSDTWPFDPAPFRR